MRRIAAALFPVLFLACRMFAQEGSATLTGFIQDSSKAVIPGVKITAIDTNTNQRFDATSDKDGSYTIVSLPVGPYQVQIEKPGFKTILKDDLFLHTQDALQINFQMAVGSSSETVTVNGQTTSDSPGISLVVNHSFVEDMPLNGRSFQDLIALAPGAVSNGNYFSIDGQRNDTNNFSVDGVSANTSANPKSSVDQLAGVLPGQTIVGTTQALASVDALEEFQIQTSGYAAEYGRQPGGQVAITTRSGTNSYHGTAFDFFRNTVLDANDWFSNNAGISRGGLHQNDFGGTLGGPFTLPRLYNGKDRTFFFFNYEGLRLVVPATNSEPAVPTLAFRESASTAVQPYLNTFPLPNGPANPDGITAAFFAQQSDPTHVDSWSIRIDHSFGDKLHIFGRFADDPTYSAGFTDPASVDEHNIQNTASTTLGSTWSITPTLVNELRFNYSRATGFLLDTQDSFGGSEPLPLTLLLSQGSLDSGSYIGNVIISVPNTSLNGGPYYQSSPQWQRQFNILDSFAWSHGTHTVKAGVDYRRLSPREGGGANQIFLEILSSQSIENGIADSVYQNNRPDYYPLFSNLSLYAQDHWALTKRLSIDYGLRWELNPPPSLSRDNPNLALTAPTSTNSLASAQFAPFGTPSYHTTYDNFAPRFAFAWTATRSNRHAIVLKGGGGIFFDTGQAQSVAGGLPPITIKLGSFGPVPLPLTAAQLVVPALTLPPSPPYLFVALVEPNLKLPYTEQWNLSVDVGMTSKNVLTASYIGNEGKHLLFTASVPAGGNPAVIAGGELVSNEAASNYEALQIQDRGFVAPGLQLITSYSWSHSIDDISNDGGTSTLPDRGNSDFDIRQVLNAALNYEIPSARTGGLTGKLTHGWMLANRFVAETGYPLQIVQGYYYPYGSTNLQETIFPDRVTGVPVYLHNVSSAPGGWQLNPSAFASVSLNSDGSPTVNGTLGRNSVYGPAFWNLDTAAQRSFSISERLRLDFRVEAFNIFNHPNFGDINTTLGEATFGLAQSQTELGGSTYAPGYPRSLQLSMKLKF